MAYEYKEATGTLFKNDRKTKDSHPDYNGKAMVGGVLHYMDAWEKDNGRLSVAFKPVGEKKAEPKQEKKSPGYEDMDSVPF